MKRTADVALDSFESGDLVTWEVKGISQLGVAFLSIDDWQRQPASLGFRAPAALEDGHCLIWGMGTNSCEPALMSLPRSECAAASAAHVEDACAAAMLDPLAVEGFLKAYQAAFSKLNKRARSAAPAAATAPCSTAKLSAGRVKCSKVAANAGARRRAGRQAPAAKAPCGEASNSKRIVETSVTRHTFELGKTNNEGAAAAAAAAASGAAAAAGKRQRKGREFLHLGTIELHQAGHDVKSVGPVATRTRKPPKAAPKAAVAKALPEKTSLRAAAIAAKRNLGSAGSASGHFDVSADVSGDGARAQSMEGAAGHDVGSTRACRPARSAAVRANQALASNANTASNSSNNNNRNSASFSSGATSVEPSSDSEAEWDEGHAVKLLSAAAAAPPGSGVLDIVARAGTGAVEAAAVAAAAAAVNAPAEKGSESSDNGGGSSAPAPCGITSAAGATASLETGASSAASGLKLAPPAENEGATEEMDALPAREASLLQSNGGLADDQLTPTAQGASSTHGTATLPLQAGASSASSGVKCALPADNEGAAEPSGRLSEMDALLAREASLLQSNGVLAEGQFAATAEGASSTHDASAGSDAHERKCRRGEHEQVLEESIAPRTKRGPAAAAASADNVNRARASAAATPRKRTSAAAASKTGVRKPFFAPGPGKKKAAVPRFGHDAATALGAEDSVDGTGARRSTRQNQGAVDCSAVLASEHTLEVEDNEAAAAAATAAVAAAAAAAAVASAGNGASPATRRANGRTGGSSAQRTRSSPQKKQQQPVAAAVNGVGAAAVTKGAAAAAARASSCALGGYADEVALALQGALSSMRELPDADNEVPELETPLANAWRSAAAAAQARGVPQRDQERGYPLLEGNTLLGGSLAWDTTKFRDGDPLGCVAPTAAASGENGHANGDLTKQGRAARAARTSSESKQALVARLAGNRITPHTLVPPLWYAASGAEGASSSGGVTEEQPFKVRMHPAAAFTCDLHAHLATSEIIGQLAGWFDAKEKTLWIQAAFPCASTVRADGDDGTTDVEMEGVAQVEISTLINSLGLLVVGWYHSHPQFEPIPSRVDIENHSRFQEMYERADAGVRFVGLIVGTYKPHPASRAHQPQGSKSVLNFFHTKKEEFGKRQEIVHCPFRLEARVLEPVPRSALNGGGSSDKNATAAGSLAQQRHELLQNAAMWDVIRQGRQDQALAAAGALGLQYKEKRVKPGQSKASVVPVGPARPAQPVLYLVGVVACPCCRPSGRGAVDCRIVDRHGLAADQEFGEPAPGAAAAAEVAAAAAGPSEAHVAAALDGADAASSQQGAVAAFAPVGCASSAARDWSKPLQLSEPSQDPSTWPRASLVPSAAYVPAPLTQAPPECTMAVQEQLSSGLNGLTASAVAAACVGAGSAAEFEPSLERIRQFCGAEGAGAAAVAAGGSAMDVVQEGDVPDDVTAHTEVSSEMDEESMNVEVDILGEDEKPDGDGGMAGLLRVEQEARAHDFFKGSMGVKDHSWQAATLPCAPGWGQTSQATPTLALNGYRDVSSAADASRAVPAAAATTTAAAAAAAAATAAARGAAAAAAAAATAATPKSDAHASNFAGAARNVLSEAPERPWNLLMTEAPSSAEEVGEALLRQFCNPPQALDCELWPVLDGKYGPGAVAAALAARRLACYYSRFPTRDEFTKMWRGDVSKAEKLTGALEAWLPALEIEPEDRLPFLRDVLQLFSSWWGAAKTAGLEVNKPRPARVNSSAGNASDGGGSRSSGGDSGSGGGTKRIVEEGPTKGGAKGKGKRARDDSASEAEYEPEKTRGKRARRT